MGDEASGSGSGCTSERKSCSRQRIPGVARGCLCLVRGKDPVVWYRVQAGLASLHLYRQDNKRDRKKKKGREQRVVSIRYNGVGGDIWYCDGGD